MDSMLVEERIMNILGYSYLPDPVGRLGEGTWRHFDGHQVDARDLRSRIDGETDRFGTLAEWDDPQLDGDSGDGISIEPVGDDGRDQKAGKPRGMANPASREALRLGQEKHKQLEEYVNKKGPGWRYGNPIPFQGKNYYPDVVTPRDVYLEMKPPTSSGARAGAKQAKFYGRITDRPSKSFSYLEFRLPPRTPNLADELGGWKPPTQLGAPGTSMGARTAFPPRPMLESIPRPIMKAAPRTSPVGGPGGGRLYPKLNILPPYLRRQWEILE
ncbi:MAG: hypothetical protein KIT16_12290 [Rhodospirillaceae bacterium]|nr:hypothetical protein [Rhodospirillaceae bacterium]